MTSKSYGAIFLAAGKGTRMNSNSPKVLHNIGGKPMINHLINTVNNIDCQQKIIIYGFGGDKLQQAITEPDIDWVCQEKQLGTGHAVLQTIDLLDCERTYLILVGDAPLIKQQTLQKLLDQSQPTGIAVLTVSMDNPENYGRIIKNNSDDVIAIVEEKDASPQQRLINEVNSGIFAIKGSILIELLPKLQNNNAQNEFYLTDIVTLATDNNYCVKSITTNDISEVFGCNDKVQLAKLERMYQQRQAIDLLQKGVTIADPARLDIRGELTTGIDCEIDINCIFIGVVKLGNNVKIAANCIITDSTIGDNSVIKPNSIIEKSVVDNLVEVGPFARIRPNTHLAEKSKIGNFVETKNANINKNSKVSHLSYIGDATVGKSVNIGAGTITCNYDGQNKFHTTIEDNSFIGSNTALVAPVTIGKNSTIGAGSVITKNVENNSLAIARGKQISISDWKSNK